MTNISWLSPEQRKDYRDKWNYVAKMVDRWHIMRPGDDIKVFSGKKTVEQEIKDLEDLSLAAYRARKLLKKQLAITEERFKYND